MTSRSRALEILLVWVCLLLGYFYVESQGVSPEHHRFYEAQIGRLEALDARANQDVLLVHAGLVGSYDALVQGRLESQRVHASLSGAPSYVSESARARYAEALERCHSAFVEKQRLIERLKTTHAAVRSSLVYLPIVSRALVDELGARDDLSWQVQVELRDDVSRVIEFVASPGPSQRRAAAAAVARLREVADSPGPPVDVALLEAVATHAANVLALEMERVTLVERIVASPTAEGIAGLYDVYRPAWVEASRRAGRFQLALYGCTAFLFVLAALALRRLVAARADVEALNESLERRVEERTAELARTRDQLEDSNDALREAYVNLDENRREQLQVRDKFLSHVSHELRTPLAAVHQFVSLVLDEVAGPVPEQQREYLDIAMRNANQLNRMIADLMEVTRAQSGKLRIECHPMDVDGLIADTCRTLSGRAEEHGLTIEYRSPEQARNAYADPVRVRQVLSNLIENAIKFSSEGGRIEIGLEHDPDADQLVVSVGDSGCGIDPGSLERVFDQLHQEGAAEVRSRKGLGLGLAISRELVQRQGGRIWVESELDEGSTFFFTLPAFQLADLVEDVVRREAEPADACAVLRVAVRPRSVGNLTEAIRRDVRHRLKGLVYREADTVLPLLDWRSDREDFWVVASTDAAGADAIRSRIETTLGQRAESDAYRFTVEHRVFELAGRREPAFMKQIEAIASHIQDRTGAEEEPWPTT